MVQGPTLCACHRIVHEGCLEDRGIVGEISVPGSLFSAIAKFPNHSQVLSFTCHVDGGIRGWDNEG